MNLATLRRITINEAAQVCRCRPERIRCAAVTGALPAIDQGAGRVGRRPRFLILESDLLAWLSAGKPLSPAAK
jgi:hypothetical protein